MRFADGVVVAVVVAQRTEWTWGLHRVHAEAMVLSIVGVKEFLLHHVDALDLSSCSFPANSDQRSAYSCSLGVVAVRRPSHALGGLGVGRILLKHLGGGQPRSFASRHARPQTPKPMKSKSSTGIHDCPKDSVILASAMTQSGVLGKEMKVYVDKENM